MSDQTAFIKSFNKGQITIPKSIREYFRLDEEFWLKITKTEKTIVLEPIIDQMSANLQTSLAKINESWDVSDYSKNRDLVAKRLKEQSL